jgi:hypothetical protein
VVSPVNPQDSVRSLYDTLLSTMKLSGENPAAARSKSVVKAHI